MTGLHWIYGSDLEKLEQMLPLLRTEMSKIIAAHPGEIRGEHKATIESNWTEIQSIISRVRWGYANIPASTIPEAPNGL